RLTISFGLLHTHYIGDLVTHVLFYATPTTDLCPLSLHDALPILGASYCFAAWINRPISRRSFPSCRISGTMLWGGALCQPTAMPDRKSTRLNSSHVKISYAVFCLKKKNWTIDTILIPPPLTSLKE